MILPARATSPRSTHMGYCDDPVLTSIFLTRFHHIPRVRLNFYAVFLRLLRATIEGSAHEFDPS